MPYSKSNQRPPKPPTWRAVRLADVPPAEQCGAWAAISWRQARRDLNNGLALEFTVDPSQATEFIAYVRSRLQVPVGVRVLVRKRMVVIYPKPRRHVGHNDRPPTRAMLRSEFRERLRVDAIIRTIVADAGAFLQGTPCGFDFRAALALFIESCGSDYGIGIPDVDTLAAWCNAVEFLELTSPYWTRDSEAAAEVLTSVESGAA